MIAFRKECRAYAEHWLKVQREEFKRLGVEGDWEHPYSTMDFAAEAQIAREIMKFAQNGTLYRGSKPVMWSVVEKTALAEAEVEYEDYTSRSGVGEVSGQVDRRPSPMTRCSIDGASVVIWTTTPWTIPGNRAISFSPKIAYGLYEVTDAPDGQLGRRSATSSCSRDNLAVDALRQARVTAFKQLAERAGRRAGVASSARIRCKASAAAIDFDVPLLAGDHVTDDTGTGFVHTAPGHGREDFEVWTAQRARSSPRAASTPSSPTPSTRTAPSPSRRRASPASACSTTRARRATPTRP